MLDTAIPADENLFRYNRVSAFEAPHAYALNQIKDFLVLPEMNDRFITGDDSQAWLSDDGGHANDLIVIGQDLARDPFSRWVAQRVIVWLHPLLESLKISPPVSAFGKTIYPNKKLLRLTYVVTSVLASMLPISSILVVYSMKSMRDRLAAISAFIFIFATAVAAFTGASRNEVFGLTAA